MESPSAALPVVVGRYALLLVGLQIFGGAVLGPLRQYVLHWSANSGAYIALVLTVDSIIALAIYYRLAGHHAAAFRKAALGVALTVSVLIPVEGWYLGHHTDARAAIWQVIFGVAYNVALAFLANRLRSWLESTPAPANNRWSGP